jgi:hypothetical protein
VAAVSAGPPSVCGTGKQTLSGRSDRLVEHLADEGWPEMGRRPVALGDPVDQRDPTAGVRHEIREK